MQMLMTKIKTLSMQDSETIDEFYAKLCCLSNQAFTLGEKYSSSKFVRKVLRSLPKRFSIKVTTNEEVKDLERLKIDEFIGSLETFDLNLASKKQARKFKKFERSKNTPTNKRKGVAGKEENEKDKKKGIQCYECLGYGHIQAECANTLKKK
ncbi:hypothetical protein CXB51_020222 [Gossypium anomalum]|uniref:CCHC-type domain-containing protein n=1 Tax=Gossypium anomalum TaxID=47600 RepID=A0A8J5YVX8_9ROSI|nr:hypothetical protein CXB51_020222 [Gossypium anomalum]